MQNFYNQMAGMENDAAIVQAQNSFISKVFGWMTVGLAVTGVVAYYVSTQRELLQIILRPLGIGILFVSLLGLVWYINRAIEHLSAGVATLLFAIYAALNGVFLATVFLVYTMQSIGAVFFITGGTFGLMAMYGYFTKRDLTSIGGLCAMGLIGVMIALLVNLFWQNDTFSLLLSIIGVIVFIGLTAYDTQKIKSLALADDQEGIKKYAIIGALELYLDFINLFLFLLRIFGGRR